MPSWMNHEDITLNKINKTQEDMNDLVLCKSCIEYGNCKQISGILRLKQEWIGELLFNVYRGSVR